jgi:hypothetical protein
MGPVSLLDGNLMSGLIVSPAISSKQARPDGALHVKSRLQIKSGACKERRNAVTI